MSLQEGVTGLEIHAWDHADIPLVILKKPGTQSLDPVCCVPVLPASELRLGAPLRPLFPRE